MTIYTTEKPGREKEGESQGGTAIVTKAMRDGNNDRSLGDSDTQRQPERGSQDAGRRNSIRTKTRRDLRENLHGTIVISPPAPKQGGDRAVILATPRRPATRKENQGFSSHHVNLRHAGLCNPLHSRCCCLLLRCSKPIRRIRILIEASDVKPGRSQLTAQPLSSAHSSRFSSPLFYLIKKKIGGESGNFNE